MNAPSTQFIRAIAPDVVAAHRYVSELWPALTRHDDPHDPEHIPLPHPYVVPSTSLFPYLFYWDSYFTIVGLSVDGRWDLVEGMVDNFLYEIREYGLVLNFPHPSVLTRSQPPYLTAMIRERLKHRQDLAWLREAFSLARREYEEVWLGRHNTPIGLCRYVNPENPDDELYAQWESGWDFSTRWGGRCRHLAAVDLNSNLYRYERDFVLFARMLGDQEEATRWAARAASRRERMRQLLFDPQQGLFCDYDVEQGRLVTDRPSLAAFHPLFVGLAAPEEATRVVENLSRFEQAGGLTCTERNYPVPHAPQQTGKVFEGPFQWDYPNGWAPLHWVAIQGLKRYGYFEEAARIAVKWLTLGGELFRRTGRMWEKYDVVRRSHEAVSDYQQQEGFGWTNGVFSALLGKTIGGVDYDLFGQQVVLEPLLSPTLAGQPFHARFHHYLGDELDLRWQSSPDLRRVEVSLHAAPPIPRLTVRLRDYLPQAPVQVTVGGNPVPMQRQSHLYDTVIVSLEDIEAMELVASWG